jgi:polysaccharide export outer membrane protein
MATSDAYRLITRRASDGASRLAAVLLPRMRAGFSAIASGQPGAALRIPVLVRPTRAARRSWALALCFAVATTAAAGAQGTIGPKDKLTIRVVSGVDLGVTEFAVDGEGTIDYPYLGKVKVAGLTPRELASELASKLVNARVLSGQPQLTVDLEQTPSKAVSVSGAVANPGEFAYAGDISVYNALLRAGGATVLAGDEIQVIRAPRAGQDAAEASVLTLSRLEVERGEFTNNVTLLDGDRVVVLEAKQVYIGGYVSRPAAYTVPPGTTLRQALLLAGDVTELGARNRIEILRNGKPLPDKDVDLDTTIIEPGDTINVPKRRM